MKTFNKTTVMMMICFFIGISAFADVTADFTDDQTPILISATPGIEQVSLLWEPISNKSNKDNKTGHFNFNGGSPMSDKWIIYVGGAEIDGIDMEAGDEIGVFDGDILVGAFTLDQVCTLENQFENDFYAYSFLRNGDPGYTPGNSFTIIAWDESEQIESASFEYTFSDPYGDAWTGDVFPYEDGEYSMAEFSFSSTYVPTFNIYYEDGTLVAGEVEGTTYTDIDLIGGQEYCYYVTQILEGGEESNPSNILCATPLFDDAPVLISAISGPEEINLEWVPIPENDNASKKDTGVSTGHWNVEPGPSAYSWAIYIGCAEFNIDGYDLEAGDEIAIFDGDLLVGAFTLIQICTPDNQFDNVLNAYSELSNGPGFTPGNPFIFKAWDQSENLESTIFEYEFFGGYTGDVFPPIGQPGYTGAILSFTYLVPQDLFNIYYEDGTLVASEVEGTTYTDIDLSAGQEYCYYVTQILGGDEESDPSNILCATPLYNDAPVLVSAIPGPEEINLEWEAIPENGKTSNEDAGKSRGHWNVVGNPTGYMWAIYIGGATLNGEDMVAGDEIAIFDGDLAVGVITLTQVCTPDNQFENVLNVFAELFGGPGYTVGNSFTFKAWDQSEEIEAANFEYTFSNPYGDAYVGDVFPEGEPYSMATLSFSGGGTQDLFNVYYEDGTLVAGEVEGTTYTDMDLTAGQEYCYYVTQILESGEESNPSNVLCATPLFYDAPVLVSAIPGPEEINLEWEAIPENDKTSHKNFGNDGEHWNVVGNPTGYMWAIYIGGATLNGVDMVAGDEIAIFDGDLAVGVITLTQVCTPDNQFENVLNVFAELFGGPGYTVGNTFTFKAWDQSEEIETDNFEYTFSNPYGDAYMGDVFPEGEPYSMAILSFLNEGSQDLFNVYYEDGTLVAGEVEGTTYTDMDLTAGQEYCYYVKQILEGGEESAPSNIECAIPLPQPFGTIAGTISNGIYPLESAVITLDGTTYIATSGSNGTYAIEDVEPGTYDVTASAEGYNSQTKYDQIIISEETTIVDFILLGIQNYDLETGFQFVSSRLIPENPDMLVVIEEILNENLDFIRNSQGQTLRKIGPNWINGIGDWMVDEGYLVKMYAGDSFTINGLLVDHANPISLETGFQFVSYFPETPIDAMEAFETIIGDNLNYIRNSQGQTLRKIGPNWINGLGDCQPSEGYLVKMFADDILIYPSSSSINCDEPFTDPRDGQTYNTVQIGDQCWMAENLNIGEMISGNYSQTDNGVIEKYCYDNIYANCDEYGGLYQWNEMMQYTTIQSTQGICPSGWHLPSDDEWKLLEGTVDSQYAVGDPIWNNTGWRGFDAGKNLKSTTGWYQNTGTDAFGFSTLPGGYRSVDGNFYRLGQHSHFWSSTEYSSSYRWCRDLVYDDDGVSRTDLSKLFGNSVRCILDNSIFDNLSIKNSNRTYDFSNTKTNSTEAIHFVFESGNPAEAVYTLYIKGLEIGDEVAALDGDKLVGSKRINSKNAFENELPVFSTLTNGQGYEEGNPITFKIWSGNKVVSANFIMELMYDSYVSDVYPEGDGKYSVVNITKGAIENIEESISIYPNPSKGIFNISLKGINENVQIKVFDIHGNDHRFFEMKGTGNYSTKQLDLKELTAGVYFISFNGKSFSQVEKIVIQ